jgi:hypothetical protein
MVIGGNPGIRNVRSTDREYTNRKSKEGATPYPPLQKPFTVIPHAGEANVESNSHN